jgi:hypothetical protein
MRGQPFKKIAALALPFAKTIASGLLGPAGPIANMALDAAASALGVKPERRSVEKALMNATPDQMADLRIAEISFEKAMAEIDYDVFLAETDDVQSAREMAIKTSLMPQITLSVVFIIGYFALVGMLISGEWTLETTEPMVAGLILVLTTSVTGILGFWFGSSFGSKVKDAK